MSNKFIKITLILFVIISLKHCGYQPLLTDKYQKFDIVTFDITGDKKLGQMLANRFIEVKSAENKLVFKINSAKAREISNKDDAGKIIEYSININLNLNAISVVDGNSVFAKNYSEKRTYKASNFYIDTLNREKKIEDDLIKSIANRIINDLNLVYR